MGGARQGLGWIIIRMVRGEDRRRQEGRVSFFRQFLVAVVLAGVVLEGFRQFEGVGGDHELGLGVEVLLALLSLVAAAVAVVLHRLIKIIMRREAHYLPSLNALFMQNESYSRHIRLLKQTKHTSEEKPTSNPSSLKSLTNMQKELLTLVSREISTPIKTLSDEQPPHSQAKTSVLELSPFEKRMKSERQKENDRIQRALQLSNPAIERYNRRNESAYEAMKGRISKYVRDGAKVSYKYKKSLAEIEKRKREKEDMYTQRSLSLREQMRSKMSLIISEASKVKVHRNRTDGGEDIFCQILENERDISVKRQKEEDYTKSRKRTNKTVLSTKKLAVKEEEQGKIEIVPTKQKIRQQPFANFQSSSIVGNREQAKKMQFLQQIERLKKRKQSKNVAIVQKEAQLQSRSQFLAKLMQPNSNRIATEEMIKRRSSKKSQFSDFQVISITPVIPMTESGPDRSFDLSILRK